MTNKTQVDLDKVVEKLSFNERVQYYERTDQMDKKRQALLNELDLRMRYQDVQEVKLFVQEQSLSIDDVTKVAGVVYQNLMGRSVRSFDESRKAAEVSKEYSLSAEKITGAALIAFKKAVEFETFEDTEQIRKEYGLQTEEARQIVTDSIYFVLYKEDFDKLGQLKEKYALVEEVKAEAEKEYAALMERGAFANVSFALRIAESTSLSTDQVYQAAKETFRGGLHGSNFEDFSSMIDKYSLSETDVMECAEDVVKKNVEYGNYKHALNVSRSFGVAVNGELKAVMEIIEK